MIWQNAPFKMPPAMPLSAQKGQLLLKLTASRSGNRPQSLPLPFFTLSYQVFLKAMLLIPDRGDVRSGAFWRLLLCTCRGGGGGGFLCVGCAEKIESVDDCPDRRLEGERRAVSRTLILFLAHDSSLLLLCAGKLGSGLLWWIVSVL